MSHILKMIILKVWDTNNRANPGPRVQDEQTYFEFRNQLFFFTYNERPAKLKGIDKVPFSFSSQITAEKGGFFHGHP